MKDLAEEHNLEMETKIESNINKIAWNIKNSGTPYGITDML